VSRLNQAERDGAIRSAIMLLSLLPRDCNLQVIIPALRMMRSQVKHGRPVRPVVQFADANLQEPVEK